MSLEGCKRGQKEFPEKEQRLLFRAEQGVKAEVNTESPAYIGSGIFKRKITRGTPLTRIPGSSYYEPRTDSFFQPFIQTGKGILLTAGPFFVTLFGVAALGAMGVPIPWWSDWLHGPLMFGSFIGGVLTMFAFEMG